MSSVYLNIELSASEANFTAQEIHRLPDVDFIKHLVKIILEPLRIG